MIFRDDMPNPHHGGDSYFEFDPQIGNIDELLSYRSVKETFLVNNYAQHQGNPISQPENHEINSSNNLNFALNPKSIKTKTLEKSQRSKQATGEKGNKGTDSKKNQNPLGIPAAERAQIKVESNQTLVVFKAIERDLEDQEVSVNKMLKGTIRCFFHIYQILWKILMY